MREFLVEWLTTTIMLPYYAFPVWVAWRNAWDRLEGPEGRRFIEEWLVLYLPFGTWMLLVTTNWRPKTLSNMVELFALVAAVAALALVRLWIGRRGNGRWRVRLLLLGCCAVAVALWAFTPQLAE